MLLGVGTREAIIAALVYLVAHAGYKGALFLVAGVLDHEVGTRDISALAGLRRAMPMTALAGGAAALSMAGVPLTLGFVGKDGAYEALLHTRQSFPWLLALTVVASTLLGLSGLLAGVSPFRGVAPRTEVHDPAWPLWAPPLILATIGLLAGIVAVDAQRTALECGIGNRRPVRRCLAHPLARTHTDTRAQRAHALGDRCRVCACARPSEGARGGLATEPRTGTTACFRH